VVEEEPQVVEEEPQVVEEEPKVVEEEEEPQVEKEGISCKAESPSFIEDSDSKRKGCSLEENDDAECKYNKDFGFCINDEQLSFVNNLNIIRTRIEKIKEYINIVSKLDLPKIKSKIIYELEKVKKNIEDQDKIEYYIPKNIKLDKYDKIWNSVNSIENTEKRFLKINEIISSNTLNMNTKMYYWKDRPRKPICCYHYNYLCKSYIEKNDQYRIDMLNQFGEATDGCIYCKNCGEKLDDDNFTSAEGFDKQGRVINMFSEIDEPDERDKFSPKSWVTITAIDYKLKYRLKAEIKRRPLTQEEHERLNEIELMEQMKSEELREHHDNYNYLKKLESQFKIRLNVDDVQTILEKSFNILKFTKINAIINNIQTQLNNIKSNEIKTLFKRYSTISSIDIQDIDKEIIESIINRYVTKEVKKKMIFRSLNRIYTKYDIDHEYYLNKLEYRKYLNNFENHELSTFTDIEISEQGNVLSFTIGDAVAKACENLKPETIFGTTSKNLKDNRYIMLHFYIILILSIPEYSSRNSNSRYERITYEGNYFNNYLQNPDTNINMIKLTEFYVRNQYYNIIEKKGYEYQSKELGEILKWLSDTVQEYLEDPKLPYLDLFQNKKLSKKESLELDLPPKYKLEKETMETINNYKQQVNTTKLVTKIHSTDFKTNIIYGNYTTIIPIFNKLNITNSFYTPGVPKTNYKNLKELFMNFNLPTDIPKDDNVKLYGNKRKFMVFNKNKTLNKLYMLYLTCNNDQYLNKMSYFKHEYLKLQFGDLIKQYDDNLSYANISDFFINTHRGDINLEYLEQNFMAILYIDIYYKLISQFKTNYSKFGNKINFTYLTLDIINKIKKEEVRNKLKQIYNLEQCLKFDIYSNKFIFELLNIYDDSVEERSDNGDEEIERINSEIYELYINYIQKQNELPNMNLTELTEYSELGDRELNSSDSLELLGDNYFIKTEQIKDKLLNINSINNCNTNDKYIQDNLENYFDKTMSNNWNIKKQYYINMIIDILSKNIGNTGNISMNDLYKFVNNVPPNDADVENISKMEYSHIKGIYNELLKDSIVQGEVTKEDGILHEFESISALDYIYDTKVNNYLNISTTFISNKRKREFEFKSKQSKETHNIFRSLNLGDIFLNETNEHDEGENFGDIVGEDPDDMN